MKIFDQSRREDARTLSKLSDFINTWLAPGATSNETHQPFQRLTFESKTVETVFPFSFADTGLKPSVNEKTECIFHAL
jgi:hypothetical protein